MPAETVTTQFHLPVGVQLLCVYVDKVDIQGLLEDKQQLIGALGNIDHWRNENYNKVKCNFLCILSNSILLTNFYMCILCV